MDNSLPSIVTFGYGRTNDLWPFTLIDGARSYAAVADAGVVRLGRPDAGGPHYLTILFLLGQAIENALKSYLLIRGVTEGELVKIGHDLPRVLAQTEIAGWPTQHPADHFLLNILAWLTPVAIILIMVLGGMAMANRISWGWAIGAVIGIAIAFGAPQIVTWVRGMFGV